MCIECSAVGSWVMQERAVLLPGRYSQHGAGRGYEVRSNLRNFTQQEEDTALYCVRLVVQRARSEQVA